MSATGPVPAVDPASPACCPHYHRAVELIGRRWTGAIVAVLLDQGTLRFSEIRTCLPGLSDRVLSQRAKELEAEGVLRRSVVPGPPVRVEYELTARGIELRPVVEAVQRWGRRWMDVDATPDRRRESIV